MLNGKYDYTLCVDLLRDYVMVKVRSLVLEKRVTRTRLIQFRLVYF